MEDMSRCFPVVAWPPLSTPVVGNYDDIVRRISTICWDRYEEGDDDDEHRRHRHRHSLYVGSLGPCAYVRYRLAKSSSSPPPGGGNDDDSDRRRRIASLPLLLLRDAARAVDHVLESHPPRTVVEGRITLLEGERVGALALSAVVRLALGDVAGSSRARDELLDVGARIIAVDDDDDPPSSSSLLPASECEVLYGRCGYLQAIAFVRSETDDGGYGGHVVLRIARAVLEEGERTAAAAAAAAAGGDLPLLWRWHGKAYLGAIHGVVGVLFVLLCFPREVSSIGGAMGRIRTTIAMLDGHCHASGNLRPTVLLGSSSSSRTGGGGERDDVDRLVHLCHGAPGHVLLLVKAYEVFDDVTFLERAEDIARGVLCRRGLLRKGTPFPSVYIYHSYMRIDPRRELKP